MIRSGLILTSGNATAALLGLARNIVIARLITVEDFGIASTFAITMALVEMASNFSLDRLLVQAREGEEPHFLATMHAVQAIRGLLGAAVLFAVAGPVASLFGVPEVVWAYQALALVPLLRGLAHLDMFRRQRAMQFAPAATVEVAAQSLSSLAAFPLALGLGDWRAMLLAILIQQIAFTSVSHWVAIGPYRWAWNARAIRQAVGFGWPLLLDGLLMFAIVQGERLIVGTFIGMVELGWFSVAFTLTLVPATLAARILQLFLLPQLAAARDDAPRFERLHVITMQASLFVGVAMTLAFALVGPAVLILLYGWKYEPALSVVVWLAILHGLRTARAGASIIAIARANTTNPLLANIARVSTLPIAGALVGMGAGVPTLVGMAIVGEAIALVLSLYLLRRRLALPLGELGAPLAAAMGATVLIAADAYARAWGSASAALDYVPIAFIVAALLVLWSMPELRRWSRTDLFRM